MVRSSACGRPAPDRPESEDALLAADASGVWAVSDGLGGHAGAGVASRTVVETIGRALARPPAADGPDALRRRVASAVQEAGRAVRGAAEGKPRWRDMSATLTLLAISPAGSILAHVGDSRAYRVREGRIEQLTRDHSVAWEQYEAGAFPKEALRRHPNQKLLTRTIDARKGFVVPDLAALEVHPGDVHLLASDGLTKALEDEAILATVQATPLADLAAALVEAALRIGATDDVTVVAIG